MTARELAQLRKFELMREQEFCERSLAQYYRGSSVEELWQARLRAIAEELDVLRHGIGDA